MNTIQLESSKNRLKNLQSVAISNQLSRDAIIYLVRDRNTIIQERSGITISNYEITFVLEKESEDVMLKKAYNLISFWMLDKSNYDEKNWPEIKKGIDENRLSTRNRFHE